jgi:hypothetical protein
MGYQAGEIPMDNVHGISVSGGSFPAEIWRLMMERTIGLRAPREFADPTSYPVYQTFVRGPLALSYDPYYVAPATSTATESTSTDTTPTKTPPAKQGKQDKPDKQDKDTKKPTQP